MNVPVGKMIAAKKRFFLLCVGVALVCLSFVRSSYAASQISQCENDSNNDGIIQACTWTTGALNQNNSDYAESDGVPQRWFFTHSGTGSAEVHTAVFQYDFTKNDVYAYDFLVDVDHTMPTSLINPCGNLPPFVTAEDCVNAFAVADNIPIPSDPFDAVAVREHPPSRNILFGCIQEGGSTDACTLISVGTPVHVPATNCFQNCGDSSVQITVTFTTPSTGDHLISMWWAGELAPADDPDGAGPKIGWGTGFGASSAPGASFHMRLVQLDGKNIGGEDNQLTSTLVEQSHNADLAVTKSCPGSVTAGNNVTYTIDVTNNGPNTATNVFMDDTLPIGTTFISGSTSQGTCAFLPNGTPVTALNQVIHCAVGFMQPNATVTVTIVVNVPSGFVGSSITDSATVGGPVIDPNTSNNTATCATTVNPPTNPIDLSVTKSCGSGTAIAGTDTSYTISITNNNPNNSAADTAHNVVLTDSLPGGVTFVSSNPTSPTCTESSGIVTCTFATLGPGATQNVTITVHVDPLVRGTITNTATVAGNETDNTPSNNTSSCDKVVSGQVDLSVTKSCDPTTVTAGSQVTFHVTVNNGGPSTSVDTHIEDVITPSGGVTFTFISATPSQGSGCSFNLVDTVHCVLGSITSGGSATVDITVLINSGSSGTIGDDAHIHVHNGEDTNSENDSSTCSSTVVIPTQPPVDLSITKSDFPDPVFAGSNLTYALTVTNNSTTTDATNVVLTDTLPSNTTFFSSSPGSAGFPAPPSCAESAGIVTCNLGTLPANSSTQVTITVTVDQLFVGTLHNSVTVAGDEPDPNTGNNSASADTTVNAPPPPVQVPTLTEWGMIIFMVIACLGSVYYLRRQRKV